MGKSGRLLALLLLAWALAVTAARAARDPNSFAMAHWMLDYRFGFIKRGLTGSFMALLAQGNLVAPDGRVIARVSFAVFGCFCAALLALSWRILAKSGWSVDAYLSLAAFATSAFVVTAAHLMGYLDHLVHLLTFGAVWLVLRNRAWAAGLLGLLAVLVHESFLVVGFPLVVLASAMQPGVSSRAPLRGRLIPLLLPVVAFAALVVSESFLVDRALLRQHLEQRLGTFPFIRGDMHAFVPEWLTTTTAQNLQEQAHAFAARVGHRGFQWDVLPTVVSLWLLAVTALGWKRGATWGLPMAAAIGAPLLLHLVAWDTARIWSYPVLVALGCAWIAFEQAPARRPLPVPLVGLLACAAIYWNVFMRYPLLDGLSERFSDRERMLYYAPFAAGSLIVAGMMMAWRGAGPVGSRPRR